MEAGNNTNNQESERLKAIYEAIKQLKAEKEALESENQELKAENHGLRTQVQALQNQVQEIEDKNLNLQTAQIVNHQHLDHQVIKAKIDHFVEEIDKCLTLLKTQ